MKIYELIIEPDREEHLARHGVSAEEAEEVVFGRAFASKMRLGRYGLVGQTEAGRYLMVIIAPRGKGVYGLVTARDASSSERRLFQRHWGD